VVGLLAVALPKEWLPDDEGFRSLYENSALGEHWRLADLSLRISMFHILLHRRRMF